MARMRAINACSESDWRSSANITLSAQADLHMTGLLAGLRDPQLAAALRGIHTHAAHPWTLVTLASPACRGLPSRNASIA
jgi:hypothetical protein